MDPTTIFLLGPHEARLRLERTAARLGLTYHAVEEEPPAGDDLLAAAKQADAGWIWPAYRSAAELLELRRTFADPVDEAMPRLLVPSASVLERIASAEALDALAEEVSLRRPRPGTSERASEADEEMPWSDALAIEVWLARDATDEATFLGEIDTSVRLEGRPLLAESAPPLFAMRLDGRAIAENLRDGALRLLRAIDGVGVFGVRFLLDAELRAALDEVLVGPSAWQALLEMRTGLDLLELQFELLKGGAVPTGPRPLRAESHAAAALVHAEREQARNGSEPEPVSLQWPPASPGRVRIEAVRAPEAPFPPERLHPLLRVTAIGTVRHQALQRLDRALVSLQIRGLRTEVPRLRRLLGHEVFRSGRADLALAARIEAEAAEAADAAAEDKKGRSKGRGGARR